MKLLLRRNVMYLGKIGDLVEVKPGHARNYLLPQRLAVTPTKANLRAVELEKEAYLKDLARLRAEIEARAAVINDKEITLSARANEEGHLYGSVGPAQIVAALAEQGLFVEARNIVLDEPIRRLDKYNVSIRFAEDVSAVVHVWVVRQREEGVEAPPAEADQAATQDQAPAGEPSEAE